MCGVRNLSDQMALWKTDMDPLLICTFIMLVESTVILFVIIKSTYSHCNFEVLPIQSFFKRNVDIIHYQALHHFISMDT